MLLTVACRPSLRISATTASIVASSRCANSLWSMAMSVSRPAESVARRAPGISRSMRSSTRCMRAKLAARRAASRRKYRRGGTGCRLSPGRQGGGGSSATAPFSATMASTGQVAMKGRLQPTGRPVMATTFKPAARRSARARRASGVMAPSVVSVSSMSVKTPVSAARSAAGQVASGRMRADGDAEAAAVPGRPSGAVAGRSSPPPATPKTR